ncbi:MAG: hypothetical protein ACI9OJ_005452, partial [Myxococcota bacterium]
MNHVRTFFIHTAFTFAFAAASTPTLHAQDANGSSGGSGSSAPPLSVLRAVYVGSGEIVLDGVPDEAIW